MIRNYDDFIRELCAAGFSQFGGHKNAVMSLIAYGWGAEPPDTVQWHSGDPDRDPWEWRMRVFAESDIAYAKVFFGHSGFITREWYPYFLAARQGGRGLREAYADGMVSRMAKRMYDLLQGEGAMPVHELKARLGVGKEDKSAYERALVELQMGLYITLCGQAQKVSRMGESYGWHSNMLCTAEDFWPAEVFEQAARFTQDGAGEAIAAQIAKRNPAADSKKVRKFIYGR